MMKAVVIPLTVLFILSIALPIVHAQENCRHVCYGNVAACEGNITIDGDTIEINKTVLCANGCDPNTNQCKFENSMQSWMFVGAFFTIIFIVGGAIYKYA